MIDKSCPFVYTVSMMRNTKNRLIKAAGKSHREGVTIIQLLEMFPDETTATKC